MMPTLIMVSNPPQIRPLMVATPNSLRNGPDARGHFGAYGGRFVAETLMPLILSLEQAYEAAGIGPQDLSCVELHDASAPSEISAYEYLGLCQAGEGPRLIESRATYLGGRIPVNTSGGLLRKGHPVGATGCAQIVELTEQLRGQSGPRQVAGARIALAHNGGGAIGTDAAATVVTILERAD